MRLTHTLLILTVLLFSCNSKRLSTSKSQVLLKENTSHLQSPNLAPFYHGVASGDPLQTSLLLWTRVTPKYTEKKVSVEWELAKDKTFKNIIKKGKASTGPERDFTVKVIAEGLTPNTIYYYRFKSMGKSSKIGRSKTLAADSEEVHLAFVSCSNIEFGYFNAYAAICEDDVDAVIHLGDYFYEYGPNVYGDTSFNRKNIPAREIISLQDYRDRYSQYRLDEDLQNVHGKFAFINIWDDHEITNNAYVDGAQNHQDDEGDYVKRKNIAKQAFYEWLPIRESKHHYRKFSFGKEVDLIMLDERLAGRTLQPDSISDPRRMEANHSLLGNTQMDWLQSSLKQSKATWKVIGNQVIFSYCDWGYDGFKFNMDAWDGYPNDQANLKSSIQKNNIENVIFVTGDTHTAWAFEATNNPFEDYDQNTGEGAIGIELGVTSVSSGNSNERNPDNKVIAHEQKISNSKLNPHLKYVNMRDHGYLKLSINKTQLKAEYKIVPTLKTRTSKSSIDKTFIVEKGKTKLVEK